MPRRSDTHGIKEQIGNWGTASCCTYVKCNYPIARRSYAKRETLLRSANAICPLCATPIVVSLIWVRQASAFPNIPTIRVLTLAHDRNASTSCMTVSIPYLGTIIYCIEVNYTDTLAQVIVTRTGIQLLHIYVTSLATICTSWIWAREN